MRDIQAAVPESVRISFQERFSLDHKLEAAFSLDIETGHMESSTF